MKKDIEFVKSLFDDEEEFVEFMAHLHRTDRKPFYYALIKGHEMMIDKDAVDSMFWNVDTLSNDMFPGSRYSDIDSRYIASLPIEEWNKLGINESNADFIKVEEEE